MGEERPLSNSDSPPDRELVFYTNPMSRGTHRAVDAGGAGGSVPRGDPRIRAADEVAGLSRGQPDGEGAGDPPRGYGRHRGAGDLRLSRRCVPRGRARAAGGRAGRLLPLAVLRRRAARSRRDQPQFRPCPAPGQGGDGGLRQFRADDGHAREGGRRRGLRGGRELHGPPTSMSVRTSSGGCTTT